MKKSKFTESQIAFVLQQAEAGVPIAEVCRKAGISDATFYNWRKKYAGLMPSEMRRLKQLEGHCHVWMAPIWQGEFMRCFNQAVGCSHVSGL